MSTSSRRNSVAKYIVPEPGMPSEAEGASVAHAGATPALDGSVKLETGSVHSNATGTESQFLMEVEALQERKTEDALFGTLFTMTSRNSQTTSRLSTRVVVFLVFTLLDFVQLIGLAYDETVWSPDVLGWLSFFFEITRRLNAMGRMWQIAFYYLAAVSVLTALGLLIYVGVLFKRDRFQMLPVKTLRILVTILVTALYITVLEVLITPFDCVFSGNCLEVGSLVQMGISLLLLLLFGPFCLLMALVFHDSEVHSPDLESRPTGRGDLLYLAARTVLVLVRHFAWPYSPSLVSLLVALAAGAQSLYTAIILPYYRRSINTFKAWLFMSAAVFSLGTIALRGSSPEGRYSASIGVLVAFVPLGALGAVVAEYRHYRIARVFLRVPAAHAAVLVAGGCSQEEAASRAAESATASEASASDGIARSLLRRARTVSRSISALGGPLAAALSLDDGDDGREASTAGQGPFLLEQEVEVAVRFLRLARRPNSALLDAAEAIFKRGMQQFPKSAYVRITYASFLQSYRKNVPGAMVALKDAWQRKPPFDQRFWLSSIRRSWEQMNQSDSAGNGESLSFIKMLEFKRLLTVTQAHHNQSVIHVRAFWRGLARKRVLLPAVLDNVGRKLEELRQVKSRADEGYRRLLAQYPRSKLLIRSYAAFLLHVSNEAEAAAVQFAKADEIEEAEMRERLANGGAGGSSVGTSSQGTSEDKGSVGSSSHSSSAKRKGGSGDFEIIQQENGAMKILKVGIVVGIGILMALSAISYAVIRDLFGGYDQSVKRNKGVIALLRMILEACHQTRTLNLAAVEDDKATMAATVESLSTMSETFLNAFRSIYMGINGVTRSNDAAVNRMWTDQSVIMQKYVSIPPAHYVDTYTSLWDAGNLLATKARQYSHSTVADWKDAQASELFRYVTRNAMYGFQKAMESAADVYQQETYISTTSSKSVLGILLALFISTIAVLILGLLMPAFAKVRKNQRGVSDILLCMPRALMRQLSRHYAHVRLVGDRADDSDQDSSGDEKEGARAHAAAAGGNELESAGESSNAGEGRKAEKSEGAREAASHGGRNRKGRQKARQAESSTSSDEESSGQELARAEAEEAPERRSRPHRKSTSNEPHAKEEKGAHSKRRARGRSVGSHSSSRVAPEPEPDDGPARGRERAPQPAPAPRPRAASTPPLSLENLQRLGSEAPGAATLRHIALQHSSQRRAPSPARGAAELAAGIAESDVEAAIRAGAVAPAPPSARSNGSGSSSARRRFLPEVELPYAPAVVADDGFGEVTILPDGSFEASAHDSSLSTPPEEDLKASASPVSDAASCSSDAMRKGADPCASPASTSFASASGGILRKAGRGSTPPSLAPPERERRRSVVFGEGAGLKEEVHRFEAGPGERDPLAEILGAANLWAPPRPPELPVPPYEPTSTTCTPRKDEKKKGKEEGSKDGSGEEEQKKKRKAKKEASAGKPGPAGVNNLLTSLTRKYLTWFLIIALVMAGNFALCFFFMDQGKTASMEIKYGGTRRAVVRELAFLSRELFINDELIMPFSELKVRLESRMRELRVIHAGLKYGNDTMGLPGQNNRYPKLDDLMYLPSCLLDNAAACEALSPERKDAYNYGVDNLVAVFLDRVTDILSEAECMEKRCPVAGELSRATSRSYAFIQESFGFLDAGLGKCIDLTVEESVSRIDVVYLVEGVILAFNVVSLASLYLLMFRPMIKQLDDESTRRAQLLAMFPRAIIKDNAFLHKYFRGGAGGGAGEEGRRKEGRGKGGSDSSSDDEREKAT